MNRRNSYLAASALMACALAMPGLAQAARQSVNCTLKDVGIFENRVHVECLYMGALGLGIGNKPAPHPSATFFAVPIDTPMAARVTELGAAMLNSKKRQVDVFYDDDPRANPPGCQANDCRRLLGIVAYW